MKNKTQIIWITILVIVLISSFFIFRNNTENNEVNEENSVPNPTSSVAPTEEASTPSGKTISVKTYTYTEIAKHNNRNDCWLVIDNNVYNVTGFIDNHPGGKDILKGCGKDATGMFAREKEHKENSANSLLPPYLIGTLK